MLETFLVNPLVLPVVTLKYSINNNSSVLTMALQNKLLHGNTLLLQMPLVNLLSLHKPLQAHSAVVEVYSTVLVLAVNKLLRAQKNEVLL